MIPLFSVSRLGLFQVQFILSSLQENNMNPLHEPTLTTLHSHTDPDPLGTYLQSPGPAEGTPSEHEKPSSTRAA